MFYDPNMQRYKKEHIWFKSKNECMCIVHRNNKIERVFSMSVHGLSSSESEMYSM